MKNIYLLVGLILFGCSNKEIDSAEIDSAEIVSKIVLPKIINETSGLEFYNNNFITHNDSGGEPSLYLFNEEVTHNVGRTFSIEYNPIDSGCNLEIDTSNLIIKDDKRGIYDAIIKLDYNIYDIFRIYEREDDTVANTYAL